MREPATQKIYDVQSKFYDATFGRLVKRRIATAIIQHVRLEPGMTVLDVGIGTGASLNYYPKDRGQIVGVDLSAGMLGKAAIRLQETGRGNALLARANALTLPFADDSFDGIFVSHVISVVSDPVRLLDECCRVSKAGSRIVMVNHFQSTNRFVAAVERLLSPLCTKLGWRSDLPLQEIVEKSGVTVDYRYKLSTPDLWETVVITNTKPRQGKS
jgi:phosphatidylethanolamine/phosphatidyl-N-methylethanolamine N-methyltransferase